MPELLKPDICIIGADAGGLSVAAAAAALRVSVVLIERGDLAGRQLRHDCVPSKALIAAAQAAQTLRTAGKFGIRSQEPVVEFAGLHEHIRLVQRRIGLQNTAARFEALGVRIVRASPRFVSADTVEAGGVTIKARRFVVATGSAATPLALEGIDLVRPLTAASIFDVAELPSRLVIVGAGPVGIELAQAYRRLGSEVTVVDAGQALAAMDPEMAAPVLRQLTLEGVILRENVQLVRVEPRGVGVRLYLAGARIEETMDGSHLLIAAGRRPNVEGLGLEAAGVRFDKGGIKVGTGLRTSNRKIHALGDVVGQGQTAHLAEYQAGLVLRSILFRQMVTARLDEVPSVLFSAPEIACIGLSEERARALHGTIGVLRWPFSENDCALAERKTMGLIKVITGRKGLILGVGICGDGAGELIAPWSLAIGRKMKISDMNNFMVPYPTRSDISRSVAISAFSAQLRSPWLSRWLAFLRWFG